METFDENRPPSPPPPPQLPPNAANENATAVAPFAEEVMSTDENAAAIVEPTAAEDGNVPANNAQQQTPPKKKYSRWSRPVDLTPLPRGTIKGTTLPTQKKFMTEEEYDKILLKLKRNAVSKSPVPNHVKEMIHHMNLSEIEDQNLRASLFIRGLYGKNMSGATAKQYFRIVKKELFPKAKCGVNMLYFDKNKKLGDKKLQQTRRFSDAEFLKIASYVNEKVPPLERKRQEWSAETKRLTSAVDDEDYFMENPDSEVYEDIYLKLGPFKHDGFTRNDLIFLKLVKFIFHTGLRVHEALQLTTHHLVDLLNGESKIEIYLKGYLPPVGESGRKFPLSEKQIEKKKKNAAGGKSRWWEVIYNDDFENFLKNIILPEFRDEFVHRVPVSETVRIDAQSLTGKFVTHRYQVKDDRFFALLFPLSATAVSGKFDALWCKLMPDREKPYGLGLHSIRNYMASAIVKNNGNWGLAKQMLQHKSMKMTALYARKDHCKALGELNVVTTRKKEGEAAGGSTER